MATVTDSLQNRLKQKALLLMCAIFFVIAALSVYFIEVLTQSAQEKNLALKHRIVEQAFNGYLARAEDEMKFIGQDLSLSNYVVGRELDLLFSHHEVLFFGGLDFFYIEWTDGRYSMDPRARLFTKVDLRSVLDDGLINRWTSVETKDNATLLMLKTTLLSDEQDNTGFLYGFISLNDNLTLVNELLESAGVSAVRIYDVSHNRVLLEEHRTGVDQSDAMLRARLPLISPVQADLLLDVIETHTFSSVLFSNALPLISAVFLVLFGFYFVLSRQIKTAIFQPIEAMVYDHEEAVLPYVELQPIQHQSRQLVASIKAKEQRFMLLAESIHSAIVFCNEIAEIELLNPEAQRIFPGSDKARTVFDFMPIACHQPIQEALKGNVGVTFDLTFNELGQIYHWQAHSFKNESGYRGLLLVGKNITQETRLTWQLDQLQPLSSSYQKTVDSDAVLSELAYLAKLPNSVGSDSLKGWLSLLLSVLDDIAVVESDVDLMPLGTVFCQESERVMLAMGVEANRAKIDCSVETGAKVVAVDAHFRGLIRVLLMMVMSNDMAERRLSVRFNKTELEMVAMNDMALRPLFFWMIKRLLADVNGQQKTLQNGALQLNMAMQEQESDAPQPSLAPNRVVAWVANDYPNADAVSEALERFGLIVKSYVSVDSFFTQSSALSQFDAVLIGCDKETEAQANITLSLKLKHKRDHLPIVWLNSTLPVDVAEHVYTLQGGFFDYNLYQVLLKACSVEGICTVHANEQDMCWVMVGGSRVTKAIWYTELEQYNIATQWLADLHSHHVVLSYQPKAVVVLLEAQPAAEIEAAQSAFPNVAFYSVQRWPEMPDNVVFFDMVSPNSSEQIRFFTQDVMKQNTNSRSNE